MSPENLQKHGFWPAENPPEKERAYFQGQATISA